MNRAPLLVFVGLAGLYALLPAAHWTRPHVPDVRTHTPGPELVERCNPLAAHWTPANSNPSLDAWAHCMNLHP